MNSHTDLDPVAAAYAERDRLPIILKPLHRFQTGLPDLEAGAPSSGPVRESARDFALLALFVAIAASLGAGASLGGWFSLAAIPAFYAGLAVTGRLRKFTVGHMHEAGHGVGFDGWRARGLARRGVRRLRFWLAEAFSVVTLGVSASVYMRAHGRHHRVPLLGTIHEPDGAELGAQGFVRGMSKGAFYRRLLGKLFNPLWYVEQNAARLSATLRGGKPVRRVAAAGWLATLIGLAAVLPPAAWLAAIGLPWFVLYPTASLLQVLTEHPYGDRKGAASLAEYAERTWDRLPWDAWPRFARRFGSDLQAFSLWVLRYLVIQLPSRLAVLDRTMIWHRWHHLAWLLGRPFDAWWTIAFEARDAWRDGCLPVGWERNLLSGLDAALERQRQHMEELD